MMIYCCGCHTEVKARLTDGREIYPHRSDLGRLPFWKCDTCGNYVGCHHKTNQRTRPLGNIPTKEIREARKLIHALLDPIWKSGQYRRSDVYAYLSDRIGWKYHTAIIRTVDEANAVVRHLQELVGK
jgi:hypothetical protein